MDRELRQLVDDARLDAAAAERRERRRHAEVAAADASVGGALVDTAEGGAPVVVLSASGRSYAGCLAQVGDGVVEVRGPSTTVLVRRAVGLRGRGLPVPTGARLPASASLEDRLVGIAPGTGVELVLGDHEVTGELVAMGADVLTVGLAGGDRCYVPAAAVDDVVLRSG